MDDLKMLDIKGNGDEKCNTLQIPWWTDIVTPLRIEEWRANLNSHQDKEFYAYIISGIANGFRIGYDRQGYCRSAKSNMPSARKNPGVVDNYLKVEIEEGRVLGPITQSDSLHINRFGVIPKRHQMGKLMEIDCKFVPPRGGKHKRWYPTRKVFLEVSFSG